MLAAFAKQSENTLKTTFQILDRYLIDCIYNWQLKNMEKHNLQETVVLPLIISDAGQ